MMMPRLAQELMIGIARGYGMRGTPHDLASSVTFAVGAIAMTEPTSEASLLCENRGVGLPGWWRLWNEAMDRDTYAHR
jgi:hypothetical protein